jgi:starch-binding outer membrane protein, SusD/RagB family
MEKLVKNTLYVFTMAISLFACSLEEVPYSAIFTQNFYKNSSEAEAAVTATYAQLINMYGATGVVLAPELSSDQFFPRNVVARSVYTLYTYDPTFSAQASFGRAAESPRSIWQYCYAGIEKANWVIEKVPGVPMDTVRRNEMLGEGYFLRAYFHWMLTKNFGDVIIKTAPSNSLSNSIVGKSPKADVYKQIYADLNKAIPLLKSYSPTLVKGRPSKEAAQALLAKAALYNEDWANALALSQAVINSGKYTLVPNVADLYDVSKEDMARQENIWAIEAEANTNPVRTATYQYLFSANGPSTSVFVFYSFYQSFDPKDTRKTMLELVNAPSITPNGVSMKKLKDTYLPNGNFYNTNTPIVRLADVYLIAAEAEARINGATELAYQNINIVRNRAGLENLSPGLSKDAFIKALLQERSWELFGEGDRWYDLTRTNTFLTVIPQATNNVFPVRTPLAKHRYFPIPQEEINANTALVQNPDWL